MKYLHFEEFRRHLLEELPDRPFPIYLLLLPDPHERAFLKRLLLEALMVDMREEVPLNALCDALSSFDLFATKRCFTSDMIESHSAGDFRRLLSLLHSPSPDLTLILSGSALTPSFYDRVREKALLLDLTGEKPVQKKRRLLQWMDEIAHKKKKRLDREAAHLLYAIASRDFAAFLQEIEKISLFVGEREAITRSDCEAISSISPTQKEWELARAIVWESELPPLESLPPFEPFIGQLRYHLKFGLFLTTALQKRGGERLIAQSYPKLRPWAIDKHRERARALTADYFLEGLRELFSLELRFRQSHADAPFLLDLFLLRLQKAR